jgi:2-methylcitrate dehydratase
MDQTVEKLVAYVSALTYADLTPAAIHAVKRSMIDSIGCALAAFHAEPLSRIRNLVSRVSSTHPATVIGSEIKTSPELAAFANGGMIRYLDFSDDYFGDKGDSGPHPSDNIGSILAAVESQGAGAEALLLRLRQN